MAENWYLLILSTLILQCYLGAKKVSLKSAKKSSSRLCFAPRSSFQLPERANFFFAEADKQKENIALSLPLLHEPLFSSAVSVHSLTLSSLLTLSFRRARSLSFSSFTLVLVWSCCGRKRKRKRITPQPPIDTTHTHARQRRNSGVAILMHFKSGRNQCGSSAR